MRYGFPRGLAQPENFNPDSSGCPKLEERRASSSGVRDAYSRPGGVRWQPYSHRARLPRLPGICPRSCEGRAGGGDQPARASWGTAPRSLRGAARAAPHSWTLVQAPAHPSAPAAGGKGRLALLGRSPPGHGLGAQDAPRQQSVLSLACPTRRRRERTRGELNSSQNCPLRDF